MLKEEEEEKTLSLQQGKAPLVPARQPGWHRVPSNPHPDPLGKSEQALGKDGEDADIPYAVPLTYPSIQKSRFIEDKYLLTRHVSNSVGFFFFFFLLMLSYFLMKKGLF